MSRRSAIPTVMMMLMRVSTDMFQPSGRVMPHILMTAKRATSTISSTMLHVMALMYFIV